MAKDTNPGRYAGTVAFPGDYVIWKHSTSGRWFIDRVDAGRRAQLIGAAKGYDRDGDALAAAIKDAFQQGVAGDYFVDDGSGSLIEYSKADIETVSQRKKSMGDADLRVLKKQLLK